MGFSVGPRKWSDLDAGIVAEVRNFATLVGSRDEVLDDAWWQAALIGEPPASRYALADRYGSATAYALEHVLDESLGLRRWKTAHPGTRTAQQLIFPPFTFSDIHEAEPPFWTTLTSGSHVSMLGDPGLLECWKGAFDNVQSRRFRDASRTAFENLARCEPGDDDDRASRGVEYAMYHLLREGWAQRVPIVVYW